MQFDSQLSFESEMVNSQKSQDKRNVKKLKHDLQPFKAAMVGAYNVLTWKKKYYPMLVFVGISVAYVLLDYMDLSVLTMMSLLAWLFIILGYSLPKISPWLFADVIGDGEHEAKYEAVCEKMYLIKKKFVEVAQLPFQKQMTELHLAATTLVLLPFAWISTNIDNRMLMFISALCIAMCAGLRGNRVVVKN